jgi:hypothetical protein
MIELFIAILISQPIPDTPTWKNGIQEIILSNCMPCHESGGAGPFHLRTYEAVAGRASFIVELTSSGVMPPWIPDDTGLPVRHSRSISVQDIDMIKKWLEEGKPEGEGPEIIICEGGIVLPDAMGNTNPSTPWIIPAESETRWHSGDRDKQTFVLPIQNSVPMKVTSLQFTTSAPRAVQMVGFVFDHQGRGRTFDGWDPDEPGYEMVGDIGWVPSGTHGKIGPGSGQISLPQGFHWEVPAHVDLVAETHFRPQGKEEKLSCSVAIETKATEDSRAVQEIVTMVRRIYIEAEDDNYQVGEILLLPVAVDVVGITPRAGAECTSLQISTKDIEGNLQTLLSIPRWDPHYGETVFFETPYRLEKGSSLLANWKYNNSESNPRNPFVPAKLVDLARKTGIANLILHVAPVDSVEADELAKWNLSMLRQRQRALPTVN